MEALESYYSRLWSRFFRDSITWVRDNILLACFMAIMPPIAVWVLHSNERLDWALIKITIELYLLLFGVYCLIQLCRSPKKLDEDRDSRERTLVRDVSDRDQKIRDRDEQIVERDSKIADLQKPRRTAAQQHEYDHAKSSLSKASPKAASVLKFVYRHGEQIFGMYNPAQLPDGISADEMRSIIDGLAKDGSVSRRDIQEPRNPHSVYDIAASMKPILTILLYEKLN